MFRRLLLAAPLLAIAGCAQPTSVAPRVQTFTIFFTANSASLDDGAQSNIQQAATLARQRSNSTVQVRGFAAPTTTTTTSPAYSQALSTTRAQAVTDALVNAGVPRIQINQETRGAVPYDLLPTESRRVEIVIGY